MPTARRAPRRARGRTTHAIAAGGVVWRPGSGEPEVVVAGRHRDGTWVFPKGTPDGPETLEETALREVREETGLDVRIVRPLGTVDYSFAGPGERVHKRVHFFLMEAVGGDTGAHDHEYDEVRWVPASEGRRLLSFDTYREMLDRALEAIAA